MHDTYKLKQEFDTARRVLLKNLDGDESAVMAALDQMSRAFNALLVSTMEPLDDVDIQRPVEREFLCAYAVHTETGSAHWQVAYVDGQPMDEQLSVREFTRQMTLDGWKAVSPQTFGLSTGTDTINGQPVYELYFSRRRRAHYYN